MSAYHPDEEDWNCASWMGAYANAMLNDYLEYWEITNVPLEPVFDPSRRDLHRRWYELGEASAGALHPITITNPLIEKLQAVVDLTTPGVELDSADVEPLTHALGKLPVVRDCIGFHLALEAADLLLDGAEKRVADLVARMAARRLGTRAAAFLDRVTRLYLWGFEPECVVMCAAVLEAAYESRFSDELMEELGIGKSGSEYAAYQYEGAALRSGVFTETEKRRAARVRQARNDIVHNTPGTGLSSAEALDAVVALIDRLYPAES